MAYAMKRCTALLVLLSLTGLACSELTDRADMKSQSARAISKSGEPKPTTPNGERQAAAGQTEVAYFAGGCFWGIEHYFQKGPGVIDAASGYMQGEPEKPTYQQVCTGTTGHAETVKVVFDPKKITYRRLLQAFFDMHDPTQLNHQGVDFGTQYRSGVWTTSESHRREAEAFIKELQSSSRYGGKKIVTQVEPAKTFWSAEEYHQDYVAKNARACHVADPW